jgi:serine O-acetyltransferase
MNTVVPPLPPASAVSAARPGAWSAATYRHAVRADLYRLGGRSGFKALLHSIAHDPGFAYLFWMRTCRFTRHHRWLRWFAYPVARWAFTRCRFRYGISIPFDAEIGPGFYIGHFGGIVVNGASRVGRNCNISHGVTLGQTNRGPRQGCPVLGDRVYIGPGAKVIGAVKVGDGAAIGANAVVTRDVPPNAVVAGAPARVVSMNGSAGYVEFAYED